MKEKLIGVKLTVKKHQDSGDNEVLMDTKLTDFEGIEVELQLLDKDDLVLWNVEIERPWSNLDGFENPMNWAGVFDYYLDATNGLFKQKTQ